MQRPTALDIALDTALVTGLLALAALAALAGCGSASSEIAVEPDPNAANEIVVQVTESVNQPDPLSIAAGHPPITLYGDGRLEFFDRKRTAQTGGIVAFSQVQLDAATMNRYLEAALQVSLNPGRDDERIADSSSFRLTIGAESVRISAAAADDLGVDEVLAPDVLAGAQPVVFDDVLVLGAGRSGVGTTDLVPFPADLSTWNEATVRNFAPVHCLRVTGGVATALIDDLDGVSPYGAIWLVDGEPYNIVIRPVFADEPGCEVLSDL